MRVLPPTSQLYNPSIYKRTAKFIADHKTVQAFLQKFEANTGLYSSVLAFLVGVTLKPATLLAIPSKKENKEDGKYAIARSISTAIADLGLAGLVFVPLKKCLDKNARKLHNTVNTVYHNNPDACTRFKSLYNRGMKIIGIPFFAFSKFALIPPLVLIINKREKNKSKVGNK